MAAELGGRAKNRPGYQFQTKCDTEVVLAAYLHWKEHCVERFNGIFAFAIWDGWRKELFVARDPMGVKPLFYTEQAGMFLFAARSRRCWRIRRSPRR